MPPSAPERPDLPRVLEGEEFREWWRSLTSWERRALRIVGARRQAQSDVQRAAQIVSLARFETDPRRIASQITKGALALGLSLLVIPLSVPAKLYFAALYVVTIFISSRASIRRWREAERRNLTVLDRARSGARTLPDPPASWQTLGHEPRTYDRNGGLSAFVLLAIIAEVMFLLLVAVSVSGSLRIVALGAAFFLIVTSSWRESRAVTRMTLAPEWIEVTRRLGGTRRWACGEVLAVRQVWTGSRTLRRIKVTFASATFQVWSAYFLDFEEFLALFLSSAPAERIDRAPPSARERFPFGAYVPRKEEEAGPLPVPEPRQQVLSLAYALPLLAVLMFDIVAVGRLLFD